MTLVEEVNRAFPSSQLQPYFASLSDNILLYNTHFLVLVLETQSFHLPRSLSHRNSTSFPNLKTSMSPSPINLSIHILFLILLTLLLHPTPSHTQFQSQQRQCYFPDGTPDPTGLPCDPTAPNSACCDATYGLCISDGLCLWLADFTIDRTSCTDKSWNATECPVACRNGITFPRTFHHSCVSLIWHFTRPIEID